MTSLFTPALSSLADLSPHEGLLAAEELEGIATAISERAEMWEPLVHVDPTHRRYELDVGVGDRRRGGAGYIHRVRHAGGEPAVTIHV